jgi:hypothetical protein
VSYLLQYVRRPDRLASRTPAPSVDEYTRLNRPGLYGDAYVRVFVAGSTLGRARRRLEPEFVLEIADCTTAINLEFSVASPQLRENSLFKIDTLIAALQRFRDGLADEVALAERAG